MLPVHSIIELTEKKKVFMKRIGMLYSQYQISELNFQNNLSIIWLFWLFSLEMALY